MRARGENPNVVKVRRSNRAVNRAINAEADVFTAFGENARRHARDLEGRSFDRHGVPTRRGNLEVSLPLWAERFGRHAAVDAFVAEASVAGERMGSAVNMSVTR